MIRAIKVVFNRSNTTLLSHLVQQLLFFKVTTLWLIAFLTNRLVIYKHPEQSKVQQTTLITMYKTSTIAGRRACYAHYNMLLA